MKKLIYIALFILMTNSCGKKSPCFKSYGNTETKLISDVLFTEISLHDNIDLELKYDTKTSIKIETGENLMPFIETTVNNGVLTLKNNNTCNFLRNQNSAVKITITAPAIDHLFYYGIGEIWSEDTLFFPSFEFDSYEGIGNMNLILNSNEIAIKEHIGSCDITLKGKCNSTYLYLITIGDFHCRELLSNKVHVSTDGPGEINVFAKDELKIEKRRTGSINYYGNPIVTIITNEGTGSIVKK